MKLLHSTVVLLRGFTATSLLDNHSYAFQQVCIVPTIYCELLLYAKSQMCFRIVDVDHAVVGDTYLHMHNP